MPKPKSMDYEKICGLLSDAEKDEKEGIKFYKDLAEKVGEFGPQIILHQIATDEEKHLKELQGLKQIFGCKKER